MTVDIRICDHDPMWIDSIQSENGFILQWAVLQLS